MKKILFPTDFSEAAKEAFEFALPMAKRLDCELHFLHVYHYTMTGSMYVPDALRDALEVELEEEAEKQLKHYEEKIREEKGITDVKVIDHLAYGFAQDLILQHAKDLDIDLIVMGTTGATSALGRLVGSVTAGVMAEAPCPVLAIPQGVTYRPIEHIAYASSFEDGETDVFEQLADFTECLGAQLACVHIRKTGESLDDPEVAAFDRYFLSQVKQRDLEYYMLEHEEIGEALEQFLSINKTDVLAMLTHRRSLLGKLVKPSLTRDMVLRAHVPLLAFQKETIHHLAKA
jgi:nucleotide-binding universal stress UspA family protein